MRKRIGLSWLLVGIGGMAALYLGTALPYYLTQETRLKSIVNATGNTLSDFFYANGLASFESNVAESYQLNPLGEDTIVLLNSSAGFETLAGDGSGIEAEAFTGKRETFYVNGGAIGYLAFDSGLLTAKDGTSGEFVFGVRTAPWLLVPLSLIYAGAAFWVATSVVMTALWLDFTTKLARPIGKAVESLSKAGGLDLQGWNFASNPNLMVPAIEVSTGILASNAASAEQERDKAQIILDSMTQGFLALDYGGSAILENQKASEILGAGGKGQGFANPVGEFKDSIAKVLGEGKSQSLDWERGDKIYFVTLSRFKVKEQKPGVALVFEDVSDRRRLENAKTDFFVYASHELKSPLTSIIGYQEMIRSGLLKKPAEINTALDNSIRQAKEMRGMIRDMLDLSYLESSQPRSLSPVDLGRVALSCIEDFVPEANARGVKIIRDLQSLTFDMNPQDAERLLRNLMDNALKYNRPNGSVFVGIDAKERKITVADTGVGIAKEDLARIFERFYRVKGTKAEGTGLGLAIVKHVCLYYSIKIAVESELNKGTSFVLTFPK